VDRLGRYRDPASIGYSHTLVNRRRDHRPAFRIRAKEARRAAGEGAERVHRRVADRLRPDCHVDVRLQFGRESTLTEQLANLLRKGRIAAEGRKELRSAFAVAADPAEADEIGWQ